MEVGERSSTRSQVHRSKRNLEFRFLFLFPLLTPLFLRPIVSLSSPVASCLYAPTRISVIFSIKFSICIDTGEVACGFTESLWLFRHPKGRATKKVESRFERCKNEQIEKLKASIWFDLHRLQIYNLVGNLFNFLPLPSHTHYLNQALIWPLE